MDEQKSNPMARIWEIAKPEHGRLIMSVVLAVLGVVSGIVPFVSAAKIISGMISGNREWSYYLVFVIAAFAGFALKSLFYAMGLSVSHKATFSLLGEIRKQIFLKLPRMPLGTIIDTSSGKLKQIIVDEVERMERPIAHMIPELTSNIIGALAVWVYMMIVDWRMGLICLISVPVGLMFFGFIAASYSEDYKKSVEITQDMNASIVEYVHGIEVIKAYSQSRSSFQKFKDKVLANAAFYCYWMKKTEVCQALCYTIAPCTLITVLPIGWRMYVTGSISADVFMTSIMLSMCIVGPILAAIQFTDSSAKVGTTVVTVDKLLSGEEQEHSETPVKFASHNIEFCDVNYSYHEDEEVLHHVNLSISEKSFTALVGPSGSGKSTIAKHVGGFWDVKDGSVKMDGKDFVILDEATAYIEPENEVLIQQALTKLMRNKTVIIIAHRLSTVTNADQIVVLDEGTISSGTHDELLKSSEKYSRFIKLREEAASWKMQSA